MKKNIAFVAGLGLLAILFVQIDMGPRSRPSCAFCDQGVLERQVFYRDSGALGVLTYKPAVPGHVLIVPERHVERFEDLSPYELAAMQRVILKVDAAVRKTFGSTDYLLLQKNGRAAGQSVPHVHFHYVPGARFLAVRFLVSSWLKPLHEEELKRLNEALSQAISESSSTPASRL